MKRKILWFLAAVLLLTACAGLAQATVYEGSCGNNVNYRLDTETKTVTITGSGPMKDYYTETRAWKTSAITTLIVEDGVTSIGDYAFEGCYLTSVSLPDSVLRIGEYAFSSNNNNNKLNGLSLPADLREIGFKAFYNCTLPQTLTVPGGVTSIAGMAFASVKGLETLVYEDGVTGIQSSSLGTYSYIRIANIGSNAAKALGKADLSFRTEADGCNLKYVYEGEECLGLTVLNMGNVSGELTLPDGVTMISSETFKDNKTLTKIVLPGSMETIGDKAFYNCSKLVSVNLPEGLKTIGENAFYNCDLLPETMTVPGTVTSIGRNAFSSCDGLKRIILEDGVTGISQNALGSGTMNWVAKPGTPAAKAVTDAGYSYQLPADQPLFLEEIYNDEGIRIGSEVVAANKTDARVEIPEGVTSIGTEVFKGYTALTEIVLPQSLASIGNKAFWGCTGLTEITLPPNLASIGENAFYGCTGLETVIIPGNVSSIGRSAFSGCAGLEAIVFEDGATGFDAFWMTDSGVTLYANLGSAAALEISRGSGTRKNFRIPGRDDFEYTYQQSGEDQLLTLSGVVDQTISSAEIPDGIVVLGKNLFANCANLAEVSFPESLKKIESGAFDKCEQLTEYHFPDGITDISNSWRSGTSSIGFVPAYTCFASLGSDTALALGQIDEAFRIPGTKYNLMYLFDGDEQTGIELAFVDHDTIALEIPDNVTSIGYSAAMFCEVLIRVTIPDSVVQICEDAFQYCSSLQEVRIPESVTVIEEGAFSYCKALKSITIPGSIRRIEYKVFEGCDALETVTIQEGVEEIDGLAFPRVNRSKSNLKKVFVPSTVTWFGDPGYEYTNTFVGGTTIYCYKNTYAHKFAQKYGKSFQLLDDKFPTITLPASVTAAQGMPMQIRAVIFPDLADNEIRWQSTDESIATVSETGLLNPTALGTTTVRLTVEGKSKSCTVNVLPALEDFEIKQDIYVVGGYTCSVPITITPEDAAFSAMYNVEPYDWEGNKRATVSSKGIIKGILAGDAELTVYDLISATKRTATIHVCIAPTRIRLEETEMTIREGRSAMLTANVTAGGTHCVNELVTFTSGNEAVATVSEDGRVTAVGNGTAVITVKGIGSTAKATCTVTVPVIPTVRLPEEMTSIPEYAFMGTASEIYILPEKTESIGAYAFANLQAQEIQIIIPAVGVIPDDNAFSGSEDRITLILKDPDLAEWADGKHIDWEMAE